MCEWGKGGLVTIPDQHVCMDPGVATHWILTVTSSGNDNATCLLPFLTVLSLHDFWLLRYVMNIWKEKKPGDSLREGTWFFKWALANFLECEGKDPGLRSMSQEYGCGWRGQWLGWEEEDGILSVGKGQKMLREIEKALNRDERLQIRKFLFFFESSFLLIFFYTYPENMERILSYFFPPNLFSIGPDQRIERWLDSWFENYFCPCFPVELRSHFHHTYILAMCCPLGDVLIEHP